MLVKLSRGMSLVSAARKTGEGTMGGARDRSRGEIRGWVGVALTQEKGNCKVRSRWELVCDRIVFRIVSPNEKFGLKM